MFKKKDKKVNTLKIGFKLYRRQCRRKVYDSVKESFHQQCNIKGGVVFKGELRKKKKKDMNLPGKEQAQGMPFEEHQQQYLLDALS